MTGTMQALVVEVDGDAEVDEVVHDQLVVADAGVEVRELVAGRRSTARVMNGRYVRLKPSVAFHSSFTLPRATSTLA